MKLSKETLRRRKNTGPKITMLTCYDYPTAKLLDTCGIDVQLIGDSVGTNILGYPDVSMVTVADMVHHIKAVARGAKKSFVLGDMPFGSFKTKTLALANARLFMQEGADGVKIETEKESVDIIAHVASSGIPVCAHIGYTPQTPGLCPSVQGKDLERARELITLAQQSEKSGAFMIVLELIPEKLSRLITDLLTIPTIGIGAGRYCDGQVQVILDTLGLSEKTFRHAKTYADGSSLVKDAAMQYIYEVRNGLFPAEINSASMPDDVFNTLSHALSQKATAL